MVEGVRPNIPDAAEVREEAYDRGYDVVMADINVAGKDRTVNVLRRNSIYIPYISFLSELLLDLREDPDQRSDLSDIAIDVSSDLNKLFIRWGFLSDVVMDGSARLLEPEDDLRRKMEIEEIECAEVEYEFDGRSRTSYNETYLGFFQLDGKVTIGTRNGEQYNADEIFSNPSHIIEGVKGALERPRRFETFGGQTTHREAGFVFLPSFSIITSKKYLPSDTDYLYIFKKE